MNTSDYLVEAQQQLCDKKVYRALDRDPKFEITHKIQAIVEQALQTGLIDKDLAQFLTVSHPKTPLLYLLPKIHKTLSKPPGRPTVSGRGSILSNI